MSTPVRDTHTCSDRGANVCIGVRCC
jgi:hypothetical protein